MKTNNKGFTLIELLAAIAILAVISVISFVSINAVIEKNKENNCNILINNVLTASKEYISDNRYNLSGLVIKYEGDSKYVDITAETLINGKYLSDNLYDPFNGNSINSSDIKLKVYLNDDYSYKTAVISSFGGVDTSKCGLSNS